MELWEERNEFKRQVQALTAERDAAISQIGAIAKAKVEVEVERDQLQRLLDIATTALAAESDEAMEVACNQLEAERDALKAALIWASGHSDFGHGGSAHEGWEKVAGPALGNPPCAGCRLLGMEG